MVQSQSRVHSVKPMPRSLKARAILATMLILLFVFSRANAYHVKIMEALLTVNIALSLLLQELIIIHAYGA